MTEPPKEKCPRCGGDMDAGRIPIGLKWFLGYKSNTQKYLSLEVNLEKARACLGCGYIELYLDPAKLRAKLGLRDQP